jgi:hypothetical protein
VILPVSVNVGTAPITYSFTWGDGADATVITDSSGEGINGIHAFKTTGTYTIQVTANNGLQSMHTTAVVEVGTSYSVTFIREDANRGTLDPSSQANLQIKMVGKSYSSDVLDLVAGSSAKLVNSNQAKFLVQSKEVGEIRQIEVGLSRDGASYFFDQAIVRLVSTGQEWVFLYSSKISNRQTVTLKPAVMRGFKVLNATLSTPEMESTVVVDLRHRLQSIVFATGGLGLSLPPGDKSSALKLTADEIERLGESWLTQATLSITYSFARRTETKQFGLRGAIGIPTQRELNGALGLGRMRVKLMARESKQVSGVSLRLFGELVTGGLTPVLGYVYTDKFGYGFTDLNSVVARDLQQLHFVPTTLPLTAAAASTSSASGPGVGTKRVGVNVVASVRTGFWVQTRTAEGRNRTVSGSENMVAMVEGTTGYYQGAVRDNLDGTFDVSYVPQLTGKFLVSVTLGGQHIQDSPFTVVALNQSAVSRSVLDEAESAKWGANNARVSTSETGDGSANPTAPQTRRGDTWDRSGVSYAINVEHHVNFARDRGLPYEFFVDDKDAARLVRLEHNAPPGSFPDTYDLRNSPASFDQVTYWSKRSECTQLPLLTESAV